MINQINNQEESTQKPLIPLALIIILTVIAIAVAVIILNHAGMFMSVEEKTVGHFSRERTGTYSGEVFLEEYYFLADGTGKKLCTDKDGYTATDEFSWYITKKSTLVIDSYLKYNWNPNYTEYYDSSAKSTKNYWYVDKDSLYIGKNTSVNSEQYDRKTE